MGEGGWLVTADSKISKEELFARTPFSSSIQDFLCELWVLIFGIGSGGSKLAVNFAQAGVGKLRFVDPACIQAHNCIRHLASLNDVGRWKVEAVAEVALIHNPYVEIEIYPCDIFSPHSPIKPEAIFDNVDLVIAATDRREVQLLINAWVWKIGIPGVFGGCYESARGGEILYTLPGEGTPCLSCLRGGLKSPESQGPFDYSAAQNPEDYNGEPGLNASVDLVTDVETQIALGILLRKTEAHLGQLITPQFNFILVGGALATGYYRFKRPFHIFWQPFDGPRTDCDVCSN